MPAAALRRPRAALFVLFFLTGAVFATWAARIPAVQERLDLSAGELALAVLALEGGAVVGLPGGGALVARVGSRASLRLAFAIFPSALLGAALAPGLGWLALALAVWAAANSVIDVAINVEGVEFERRLRRPVLASLHAGHSLGVLAGALAGTAAAATGLGLSAHFAIAAALGLGAGQTAARRLLSEHPQPRGPLVARPDRPLLMLGVLVFCAFLVEGAAANWSAVQLRSERDASQALSAAAFTTFALAMTLGRLVGDRAVSRVGRVRFVQASGLVAAAGGALAILAPAAVPCLAGWGVLGLGLAGLAPTILGAAPAASTSAGPVAIAAVTTLGYLGSFTGPPLIGAMAELSDLSLALGLLVLAAALIAVLAGSAPGLAAVAGAPRGRVRSRSRG
jgi:MFS family permease